VTKIVNTKFLPLSLDDHTKVCIDNAKKKLASKKYKSISSRSQKEILELEDKDSTELIARIMNLTFRTLNNMILDGHDVVVPCIGHFVRSEIVAIKQEGHDKALASRGYTKFNEVLDYNLRSEIKNEVKEYRKEDCIEIYTQRIRETKKPISNINNGISTKTYTINFHKT